MLPEPVVYIDPKLQKDVARLQKKWRSVLNAPRYVDVVPRANIWWIDLWDSAYKLGLAPRGYGYSDAPFPLITFSAELPHMVVGQYEYSTLKVLPLESMKKICKKYYDQTAKNCLVYTILHECVHALDDARGVDSGDHNKWFYYRLGKLQTVFPPRKVIQ
jgi:hypothetical protein